MKIRNKKHLHNWKHCKIKDMQRCSIQLKKIKNKNKKLNIYTVKTKNRKWRK